MKYIGFEREGEAIAWAKDRLSVKGLTGFCRAISAVNKNDEFVFVVVMSNFSATNIDIHLVSSREPGWATPNALRKVFNGLYGYVFDSLQALRVTGLVKADNMNARVFAERFGMQLEGIMRKALNGSDLCIYGYLAEDYTTHPWNRK